jgi:regulator of sirC expression with transglutaminase-like and TPR domain
MGGTVAADPRTVPARRCVGTVTPVDPSERFARVVGLEEHLVGLDEACLTISATLRPEVDVDAELGRLDELGAGVQEPTLDGLRQHLFLDEGFTGDSGDYHNPRNSFLDVVVERRRGLPILLSVLTVEIGRRVGVPVAPVGMPGHFLVRDRVDPEVFVDPFHGGALLGPEDCRRIVERLHPGLRFEDRFLEPVSPRVVVVRVLANLAGSYRRLGDRQSLTKVLELRSRLPGATEREQRELALLLAAGGRYREAADRLEALAGEDDATTAARLRARLN